MNTQTKYLTAPFLLVSLTLSAFSPISHAEFKCWTNDEHVRECGSVIPPKYAKKGYKVLNKQGDEVGQQEAQKSDEELRALREKELREEAEQEAIKKREEEDRALFDAYPTESDILLAKKGKLASVEASIKVAQRQIDFFQTSLDDLLRAIERNQKKRETMIQTQGKDSTGEVDARITELEGHTADLKDKISRFTDAIQDKRKEQNEIEIRFTDYLNRYRNVKKRLAKERIQRQNKQPSSTTTGSNQAAPK